MGAVRTVAAPLVDLTVIHVLLQIDQDVDPLVTPIGATCALWWIGEARDMLGGDDATHAQPIIGHDHLQRYSGTVRIQGKLASAVLVDCICAGLAGAKA